MCGSMVDIKSAASEIRRGKKEEKEETRMWANAQPDVNSVNVNSKFI